MAEKRMFTKKITDDDNFTSLPSSAQALYFHLNLGADDDGFNNQISMAMFKAKASDDDLKALMAKNYIIRFESGVVVIKHWRMHNTLRKDRYQATNFQEDFKKLSVKTNGSYTLGCQVVAERLPDGCHSIEESSREKKRIVESSEEVGESSEEAPITPPTLPQILDYVHNNNLAVNPNRFFSYYNERNWQTSGGKPIDWIAKIHEWDYEDKQKAEATAKTESKSTGNPFLDLAKEENLI